MSTSQVAVYRSQSKRGTVVAFATAILIHLSAVAWASMLHSPASPAGNPGFPGVDVQFSDEQPVPEPEELDLSPPVESASDTDFVEAETPARPPRKRRTVSIRGAQAANGLAGRSGLAKAMAVYAPRPQYPYEARSRHVTGSGVIVLELDPATGAVLGANVVQSTGNYMLDQSALSAFRRWRFKPGTPARVAVPITFLLTGAQF